MEDSEIVDLYWARSELAIAETAQKYGSYCKSIAFRVLSDHQEADECVNDTYLGAWGAMPQQRPARLSAFLGRITRNVALNRYNHNKAQKRGGGFDVLLSELEDCLASPGGVESQYEEGRVSREISSFLRTASPDARNTFLRRYWYGDSIADISKRFAMSESKVKSMLFRTRNNLKSWLEKEGILL